MVKVRRHCAHIEELQGVADLKEDRENGPMTTLRAREAMIAVLRRDEQNYLKDGRCAVRFMTTATPNLERVGQTRPSGREAYKRTWILRLFPRQWTELLVKIPDVPCQIAPGREKKKDGHGRHGGSPRQRRYPEPLVGLLPLEDPSLAHCMYSTLCFLGPPMHMRP